MANTNKNKETSTEAGQATAPRVDWDDSKMDTTYANVANAASTREEVTLLFGTNKSWQVSGDKPVKVELTNRIILSPYAARRLMILLGNVMDEYESRFGKLDVAPPSVKVAGK